MQSATLRQVDRGPKSAECQRWLTGIKSEMAFGDLAAEKDATFETHDPGFCCIDMALTCEVAKIIGLNSQVALTRNARHSAFQYMKLRAAQSGVAH